MERALASSTEPARRVLVHSIIVESPFITPATPPSGRGPTWEPDNAYTAGMGRRTPRNPASLLASTLAVALPGAFSVAQDRAAEAETLVIDRLRNPDPAAADAAMIDLMRGGSANAPLLERVLARELPSVVRIRAARALAVCAIESPARDGIKVGLRAERRDLVRGGLGTRLVVTLANVGDAPVRLLLGSTTRGNVLQNGLALQREAAAGPPVRAQSVQGVCDTGERPLLVQLRPWTTRRFEIEVACARHPGGAGSDRAALRLDNGLAWLGLRPSPTGHRPPPPRLASRSARSGRAEAAADRARLDG